MGLRRRVASAGGVSDPRPLTPPTDTRAVPLPHRRGSVAAAAFRDPAALKAGALRDVLVSPNECPQLMIRPARILPVSGAPLGGLEFHQVYRRRTTG